MLKNYFTFPKGFADSLEEIKSSIINHAWIGLAVFFIPIMIYDIALFWSGLSVVAGLKMGFIVLTASMALWGRYVLINLRVVSFLVVLYLIIVSGVYQFGFYSNSSLFIIAYICVSFFYLRLHWFIFSVLLISSSYLVLMYLFVNGILEISLNRDFFSNNIINWIIDLMIVFLISYVSLISIFKVFKAYNIELMNHINSEKRIKHTLEFMPVPVSTFNKKREVTMVNRAYEDYFGLKLEDTPTVKAWLNKTYLDEEERKQKLIEVKNIVETFDPLKSNIIDYHVTTGKGLKKYVRVYHTLTENEVICTFIDQTERLKKRQEIIESTLRTEKKEKERIGRELHDGLGPLLTTAKIYAHSLRDEEEVNEEYLKRLDELLENALNELRLLINNESPHLLQQYGLEKAVRSFLQNIKDISDISVSLNATPLKFQKDIVEFALYRAILELINNTLKYSKANELTIRIEQVRERINVMYSDNGIGFDFEEGITKGNGLINIQNRINNVGGTIKYITSPGNGVQVIIQMEENQ
ncbi:sensor histidine kinase [Carboxylicivirga linearis]|uniref:Histidine kinase domain-containing protein n=1 Tax=Carboxylicivirga linearis TaxID=1628157 RepID=A0ABS5JX15_9BACT|nr:histidine kinase [Carboxylicivirga linearis]MBS2099467.1 hypothetical protein [Carboxylicivirga linearis]